MAQESPAAAIREPVPTAAELAGSHVAWLVLPAAGFVVGALAGGYLRMADGYLPMAAGALAGLALAWCGPLALGAYRAARIGSALRSTRRVGAVGSVEWHRRRGSDAPYLMIADSRGGPVRCCVPLLRRPHLPHGVDSVRVHGTLRPGRWAVPFLAGRPLWPVGPVRHRPLWTSKEVLGPLPGPAPAAPRRLDLKGLAADTQWRPVRLSLKHAGDRVAVVAYELRTGRVLESGFLPPGVGQGREPEQNGLYAQTPDRRTLLYGPGWAAIAVLGEDGAHAIPVRPRGMAR
jgi:hypothetical protein